ncbi:universal stress protein (plasmid) [Haloarcula marismortui ATCC 43049]|uniref:Universal stress protein n=1 Tax=Haloarcula marismortui (strain ATCC 43049 / DSM 3752 / JCM 8966 / VKM B-1809) TaxID=272569 RepID=Q5V6K3_HALMA|nr:universal stress protein [Haloarcula marismortui]AAV44849.1 universal stress protein [Haloarcula marismortui ATCC 43049]QCP90159.1 universal stress protein [Haloarcula marismortui ATCC 43049]
MFDSILVPTDGSEHATRAAEHGAALARAFSASLHVMAVIDTRTAGGPFSGGDLEDETLDRMTADAEDTVTAITDAVDAAGAIQTTIRTGNPADEICAYRDDHDIDLIAMGTHGRTGVGRYLAGSVTESVVRHADVPVFTVRATEQSRKTDSYDDILVPTDGSTAATAAVEPACEIAAQFDSRLHALNVVNLGDVATGSEYTLPTDLIDTLEAQGEKVTERIAARARESGVETVTQVVDGFPAADILDYAEENDIDLIVMGTAGRTGLNRFIMGSTTERLIRHADMPVLAVNARDQRVAEA